MARLRAVLAGVLAASVFAVTGCGFSSVYDIPLPGGADVGEQPYRVKVHFRDVLDLVPQSAVKVNQIPVGRVEKIGLAEDGWTARATLLVNGDVELPANAVARLRQSSLLGSKYVELGPPPGAGNGDGSGDGSGSNGKLTDGAVIPIERTNRNTEVEEVLGALSMLLNGGGVEQLRTITRELNNVTVGNEAEIKSLLSNVESLTSRLDQHSADITRAIDGVNRLASTLASQRDRIAGAIDNLEPGLRVLNAQREQLVGMLRSLQELSDVAVDTVDKTKEDLIADLKALTPTLRKLAEAGADLPKALEILFTVPFTDEVVAGTKGDFVNLYADINLNVQTLLENFSRTRSNPLDGLPVLGDLTNPRNGEDPNAPPTLPLPGSDGASGDPGQNSSAGSGQAEPSSGSGMGSIFDVLSGGGS